MKPHLLSCLGLLMLLHLGLTAQQPSYVNLNASGTSTLPTPFRTGSWFPTTGSTCHNGDDAYAQDWYDRGGKTEGAPLFAVISGTIAVNHTSPTKYGNTIVLHDAQNDFAFRYAHMKDRSPVLGSITRAAAGFTFLGHVGKTAERGNPGNFGAHLHGALYKNAADPGKRPVTTVAADCDLGPGVNVTAHAASYIFEDCIPSSSTGGWHPDGSLLIDQNNTIWLVEDGKRRGIPSMTVLTASGLNLCQAVRVQPRELTNMPEGEALSAPPSRRLLRRSDGAAFLIVPKGQNRVAKRQFPSEMAYLGNGFQWDQLVAAHPGELDAIPDDSTFPVLWAPFLEGSLIQQQGSSTIYVITNGKKRAIASMDAFTALGYQTAQVTEIKKDLFDIIPDAGIGPITLSDVNGSSNPPSGGGPTSSDVELITNGGFENELSSWTIPNWGSSPAPSVSNQSRSGTRAACLGTSLGQPGSGGYSAIYQWVDIPSAATAVQLSFWYRGWTADVSTDYDGQVVKIYGADGKLIRDLMVQLDGANTWKSKTIDLSEFRGRHALLIGVYQDQANDPTGMCIDDVSIKARSGGAGSPARAQVTVTSQPDPVRRDSDGRWRYSVILRETAGVGFRIQRLTLDNRDHTADIADWFGSSRLEANGEIRVNMQSWGYSPPFELIWELLGTDDRGNEHSLRRTVRLE